jgi:hypothetical protein
VVSSNAVSGQLPDYWGRGDGLEALSEWPTIRPEAVASFVEAASAGGVTMLFMPRRAVTGAKDNESLRHAPESPLDQSAVRNLDAAYTKIAKRIIPFTVLLFLMAWLDRYNLGFAKLQMVKDLGFSEAVYGFGAGIVFLGYALFEIPSNLYLERIGARKTFA